MRITVDTDRCEGHGQCVAAAPDVYDLDEEGTVMVLVTDGFDAQAAAAGARACPVSALTVAPATGADR